MKKTVKILLIVVVVIAILVTTLAFVISPIAKNYIEKHDRELLGRSIRMEQLRMNIFTGRLRITDLKIGGAEDSTTFFRLDSFDMRMRLWPLISQRIEVQNITFTTPDVKIYQRGSVFNFDGILDHFASDSTQVEPDNTKPWEIGIYNITIRNGRLFYKDLQLNATWGLNDMDLQIPGVYFSGANTDVGAVLNFAEGGSLSTQVGYDIETEAFNIDLHLRDLTLGGTLPYFQQSLDVSAVKGRLSADINLQGDVEHLLSLRTQGTASLAGFVLHDAQQRPVMGIDTLGMKLTEGDLGRMRFHFDRLYVAGVSALFEMTSEGNNLMALMKPSTPEAPEAPATPADPADEQASTPDPEFSIADLEIAGGRITLRDLMLEKPFEYTISDIRMHSRNFNPAARNQLVIDARMQKKGSAKLRWEGSLDDINNQNITLWFTNLDLRDFTPYSEHFTAYPITNGNLSFRSQNVIHNRYLDGTNHLDVFEPKVDKKRKEMKPEMNIPLKLGLYVLKDKKGHVKMDLPVKGSLDSPEFSYRKIILKTIGNVLLKVVTAPFSFLSGHSGDLRYIDIDPQQYVFSSEQYASFDKIAQMLQDKPDMHIALTQRINMGDALPLQAANVLRMAYSDHLRSADSTAITPRPQLSMLELEKIQQINIRTPQITAFADSLLAARGISPHGLSIDEKATTLYREQAATQLARMTASRDKALANYMQSTHGLTAPAFHLQPLDSAALVNHTGRNRYTLALEVDGERVEVSEEEATASGADPSTASAPAASAPTTSVPTASVLPASTPTASAPEIAK